MKNPKLDEAIAIFKKLGWESVTAENILQLPIGTAEEKRIALAGLKSGDWSEWTKFDEHSFGFKDITGVDGKALALFSIRMGVDARRAVNMAYGVDSTALMLLIAERGAKYAADFISHACVSRRRMWEHSDSVFGNVAVILVDRLDMELPRSVEYMKDWAIYAAVVMDIKPALSSHDIRFLRKELLPTLEQIQRRFVEHVELGVAIGAPATGFFGYVLPAGVACGWLSRSQAVELVFAALDAAVRPGDRKVWLGVLDELSISDTELCERLESLISLLATSDPAVITRLAPVLIANANDEQLPELLVAAFSATSKKVKQLVLRAALGRDLENIDIVAPWLAIFANDADKTISTLAKRLMVQWGIDNEAQPDEDAAIQALWQPTPPVWQVPLLNIDEGDLETLAAELVSRKVFIHDSLAEHFLAVANAVAYKDAAIARKSLSGFRKIRTDSRFIDLISDWVNGEIGYKGDTAKERYALLLARDYAVVSHLELLPCILSTPSTVDLSIKLTDLASRLAIYKEKGIAALEADLQLAMMRLDLQSVQPADIKALKALAVPILLQSGEKMACTAGQAVLRYIDDPVKEPPLPKDGCWWNWRKKFVLPKSLSDFPDRIKQGYDMAFPIFPHWGDAAMANVRWDSEVYHDKGLILRQVVRRASPLPAGASINILAAQRSHTPTAAADSALAVSEAWERGLLRPNAADVSLLDWGGEPSNLAALATALDGIVQSGLLSVVWPILDALIVRSLAAPRLLVGTVELTGLIAKYLPEVQAAIDKGLVDAEALRLTGIRTLAGRSGSSQAVSIAKELAAKLPQIKIPAQAEPASLIMEPFDKIWPAQSKAQAIIDDGSTLTISLEKKLFLFKLVLPNIAEPASLVLTPFYIIKGWYYDLEREGQ
ncbi:MAG: hypothetical protein LBV04_08115, partial [Deferribacteraceae bacterium]|nr:hypothetical protein [Deferribacteraceae bacterium]